MNSKVKRELRSPREIRKMRTAGLIVWQAHQAAARILKPGVSTLEINQAYRDTFAEYGAESLFLNYGARPGIPAFPAETCISINEEVVHGIPGSRLIQTGDVVSLDTGCRLDGWCGDAAVTHAIGEIDQDSQRLLEVTNRVLDLAIELMGIKTKWSEVCERMEDYVVERGFFVVEDMVGHGIGKELHEPPQVPNYYNEVLMKSEDFELRPGVVIAVEPMVNIGTQELVTLEDGWTVVTENRKNSAHFEHTLAVTKSGPMRLTGPPNDEELSTMPSWLHDKSTWIIW
ncbi:MAG: methionyl aminopeptidase [Mariniblastus sp.]|jgi:methionyl aminopeptidase